MEIKEILEKISLPARSDKNGFYNTEKLDAINYLLASENSPYHLIYKSPHTWIFGQNPLQKDTLPLLVSTHSDIVKNIKKPFSEYIEDEKYFKGTYDNLGTNAACVNLMLNEELPTNVYFAFTADEETGRCNGANNALFYIRSQTNLEPTIFALDVTDEGYRKDRLFTVEGLHAQSEEIRQQMLSLFLETEGEQQSFEVVPLHKADDNSFLPEGYASKSLTVYDESVFYARQNCNSCSLCLPGTGDMHSDSGFYVKEGVLKGYSTSLLANIYKFTNTYPEKIEELKKCKDELVSYAKETEFHKSKIIYHDSFYGGDYSAYWEAYRERISEGQIPGQLSLTDFDDSFEIDEIPSAFSYNEDTSYDDYECYLDSLLSEFYEMCQYYKADEFDVFYEDAIYGYGLGRCDELEQYLKEIFEESKAMENEEYLYE